MTKHVFAGANTPTGFVNFFDQIMPLEKAKKRYFLKGSSGSGKSTFIKKIAAEFEAIEVGTEKFHCANDSSSLDALSICSRGLCIIDATAPHSCDPEIPAAIDKIIDFAEFLDEQKITRYVDEIKSLLRLKRHYNEKASSYLAAMGNIYKAENKTYEIALKKHTLQELLQEWLGILNIHGSSNYTGFDRKLFMSAVTPDGYVSFAENYFNSCKIYGICKKSRAAASYFLTELKEKANACGINTESFYCPFAPDRLDYLHLPQINTAFTVLGGRFGYNGNVEKKIDMSICIDTKILDNIKLSTSQIEDNTLFDQALDAAVYLMYSSRMHHTKIEEIYSGSMDFNKVKELTEKTVHELLNEKHFH